MLSNPRRIPSIASILSCASNVTVRRLSHGKARFIAGFVVNDSAMPFREANLSIPRDKLHVFTVCGDLATEFEAANVQVQPQRGDLSAGQ